MTAFAKYLATMTSCTAKPKPEMFASLANYWLALDAWKDAGPWLPASNGTEVPFTTRSGHKLLYCWNPRSGNHAYLDMGTDYFLTDAEAMAVLS